MSATDIVQRQLDAYNAHDLAAFVANFSDGVEVFRMPATQPALSGMGAFAQFYATQRFNVPSLHAELVNRMILGDKVVDHERIHGLPGSPFEMIVAYEVVGALIQRMWAFTPAKPA